VALPAVTTAPTLDVGVLLCELMPMDAVRLASVPRRGAISAQCVLSSGDSLEVSGIHAARVATQVVELESSGYGANEVFVHDAVNLVRLVLDLDGPVPLARVSRKDHAASCRDPAAAQDALRPSHLSLAFDHPT
jgi:hypothetical protein